MEFCLFNMLCMKLSWYENFLMLLVEVEMNVNFFLCIVIVCMFFLWWVSVCIVLLVVKFYKWIVLSYESVTSCGFSFCVNMDLMVFLCLVR